MRGLSAEEREVLETAETTCSQENHDNDETYWTFDPAVSSVLSRGLVRIEDCHCLGEDDAEHIVTTPDGRLVLAIDRELRS